MKQEPNSADSRGQPPRAGRRARTPTVLQMEATECGAAALASVLGYYGRFIPLEELRVACGVTRDGSRAVNVLRAARGYGCVAKGFKKDIGPLKRTPMPVIAFWNFRHFVVIEGFAKKRVYINDPATGPRTVTYDEFDKAYSGLVLVIEPGADFQPGGRRPSFYGALARRLSGFKGPLGWILFVGLFLVIPGVVVPILLRFFVDDVLVRRSGTLLAPLAAGMLLAILVKAVLTWVQQNSLLRLETRLTLDMSSSFLWHVLRLPVVFFAQRYGGEISSRVAINDTVAQLLSRELATNLLNGIMVVFFAGMMWYYDPLLTVISVLFALVNLAAIHVLERMRTDANQRLLQERGKLVGLSMAGLRGIETFKATGSESDFFAQWSGYQARVLNAQQQLGAPTQLLSALPSFLSAINSVAVLIIGGARVIQGQMSLGMLVAFQGLLMSFSGPISRLVNLGAQFQEAEGGLYRLDDVLNYPIGVQEDMEPLPAQPTGQTTMKLTGELELRGVTFGYSPLDPPLISDLSFRIGPGQRVAFVGPTGCGKSTIARLVCGLYEPWEGEILFDGKPRSEIPPAVLLNSLAMVDQEIFLFEGTVRENLALWDSSAPEASIIQAAKDARMHEDITARRHGYDTRVEEGGRNFSGGQSQRLEIARALVNNPTILVLDEASSALDPGTELAIDENMRRRGCACVLIAHRLSTIRDCDEIIVLDKGKVVQRGTHKELVGVSGPYMELIKE